MLKLMDIGFENYVVREKIVAIVTPNSSPMKRLREAAKSDGRLVNATCGRKTRAIVITDGHVVLSALQPDTLKKRFKGK